MEQEQLRRALFGTKQEQGTGCWAVTLGQVVWRFYLFLGRLVYATGGVHPVRRWRRLWPQYCPNYTPAPQRVETGIPWDYHLVAQAVTHGAMTKEQAQAYVQAWSQATLLECLTTWRAGEMQLQWLAQQTLPQRWMLVHVDYWWEEVQPLFRRWLAAGGIRWEQAPVIDRRGQLKNLVSPAAYQQLTQVLDGQSTFWDIAQRVGRPVEQVAASLRSLIHDAVVILKDVPDLPAPVVQVVTPRPPRPVIACIDDSPLVAQALRPILEPLGYQVWGVTDPLRSLSQLLQRQPVLIFLDLVMPETNGYEVCAFLRKSAAFQRTPIVILTGQGTVIDRVRAKLCGASDFLAKPPVAERVVEVVQTLLPQASPLAAAS
ncbi:MAG: response regulator [Gloeomargarita sp. SKYBB_i_bin120]|nr:response regulator [Gloeomargarita sp. SKYG98]MCS7292612.1 response regulator [Gloeomargarita sp. SKYB120]MDW8178173.1 response regulator [Gloeomargarita sp. SKYBB_i_bin120]